MRFLMISILLALPAYAAETFPHEIIWEQR